VNERRPFAALPRRTASSGIGSSATAPPAIPPSGRPWPVEASELVLTFVHDPARPPFRWWRTLRGSRRYDQFEGAFGFGRVGVKHRIGSAGLFRSLQHPV